MRFAGDAGLGFLEIRKQLRAPLKIGEAFVGRTHASGRAVQQAHVEVCLQLCDVA